MKKQESKELRKGLDDEESHVIDRCPKCGYAVYNVMRPKCYKCGAIINESRTDIQTDK